MELTRIDRILKCIVDHFVKYAEPLGSETMIKEYQLPYSSATVRNEMAELEEMGLIEKTHTSSGRIPSNKGYRYYNARLRNDYSVGEEFKEQFALILNEKNHSADEIIASSCEILASMTKLASVVLGPSVSYEHLVSIQAIPISNNAATAIFLTDKGYVENKTFVVPESIDVDGLKKCVELLNQRLSGTPVSELQEKMELLKPLLTEQVYQNDVVYKAFAETFIKFARERMRSFGTDSLFDQPEFAADSKKIKSLMNMLDNPEQVREFLSSNAGASVKLSDEVNNSPEEVAVISKQIRINEKEGGTIALVGPTRIDYEKALAAISYVADELSKYFSNKEEKL